MSILEEVTTMSLWSSTHDADEVQEYYLQCLGRVLHQHFCNEGISVTKCDQDTAFNFFSAERGLHTVWNMNPIWINNLKKEQVIAAIPAYDGPPPC